MYCKRLTVSEKVLDVFVMESGRWLSRRQISMKARVAKSPSLIRCLDAYVLQGLLLHDDTKDYGNGFVHLYLMTDQVASDLIMFEGGFEVK